jgi:hypothetical protein
MGDEIGESGRQISMKQPKVRGLDGFFRIF